MKNITLVSFICILLIACSSSGTYKMSARQGPLRSDYETAKITMHSNQDISEPKLLQIKSSIIGDLLSNGKIHRVSGQEGKADIVIDINITKNSETSATARFLIGMMAGSNEIDGHIVAIEGKTGKIIREFDAKGNSAKHPLSSEAGYSDAVREFSQQIIFGLSN